MRVSIDEKETNAIVALLQKISADGIDAALGTSDSYGISFKTIVERDSGKVRSYGFYSYYLKKLAETRTDVPKKLVLNVERERQRAFDAPTEGVTLSTPQTIDRNNWMSCDSIANIFGKGAEAVRRIMLLRGYGRIIDPLNSRFLYSLEDAKKIYGEPNGKPVGKAPRANHATVPVATTDTKVATSSETQDVLSLYDMLKRGLLTKEQVADALSRLQGGNRG